MRGEFLLSHHQCDSPNQSFPRRSLSIFCRISSSKYPPTPSLDFQFKPSGFDLKLTQQRLPTKNKHWNGLPRIDISAITCRMSGLSIFFSFITSPVARTSRRDSIVRVISSFQLVFRSEGQFFTRYCSFHRPKQSLPTGLACVNMLPAFALPNLFLLHMI